MATRSKLRQWAPWAAGAAGLVWLMRRGGDDAGAHRGWGGVREGLVFLPPPTPLPPRAAGDPLDPLPPRAGPRYGDPREIQITKAANFRPGSVAAADAGNPGPDYVIALAWGKGIVDVIGTIQLRAQKPSPGFKGTAKKRKQQLDAWDAKLLAGNEDVFEWPPCLQAHYEGEADNGNAIEFGNVITSPSKMCSLTVVDEPPSLVVKREGNDRTLVMRVKRGDGIVRVQINLTARFRA